MDLKNKMSITYQLDRKMHHKEKEKPKQRLNRSRNQKRNQRVLKIPIVLKKKVVQIT